MWRCLPCCAVYYCRMPHNCWCIQCDGMQPCCRGGVGVGVQMLAPSVQHHHHQQQHCRGITFCFAARSPAQAHGLSTSGP
jgi:hypothetical protein